MATITAPEFSQPARELSVGLQVTRVKYTLAAAAIGDVLQLCKLPDNAKVHMVTLCTENLGAGVTLSVGTQQTANQFLNNVSGAAANRFSSVAGTGVTGNVTLEVTAGTNDYLQVTVGGAAATGVVEVTAIYSQDD